MSRSTAEAYARHQVTVSLLMSRFLIRYLLDLHRHFEGDLGLVIVLATIAHHNTASHLKAASRSDGDLGRPTARSSTSPEPWRLEGCNALSMARATRLPRETVRRKVSRLVELGWVERSGRRDLCVTKKVGSTFLPEFNVRLVRDLLDTANRIEATLRRAPPAPHLAR